MQSGTPEFLLDRGRDTLVLGDGMGITGKGKTANSPSQWGSQTLALGLRGGGMCSPIDCLSLPDLPHQT